MKQQWDRVKRPSGEMVENPIFQNNKLMIDLEKLVGRRVPTQILSLKPDSKLSTLKRNQNAAYASV